jgi:ribonuclease BN (tRNA processing enzyme)
MPDNELRPPEQGVTSFETFRAFCDGADVLSHDAMFLASDKADRSGWGHSTVEQVLELAVAARVKHLVLFHHDPDRTDEELDRIQEQAGAYLAPHGIRCTVAYEGLSIELTAA